MDSEIYEQINEAIEQGQPDTLGQLLEPLPPAAVARIIESLPGHERLPVWQAVSLSDKGEVLLRLHSQTRRSLIDKTEQEELISVLAAMQMDELADIDEDLPITVVNAMVQAMDVQRKQRYQMVSQYPDDSAGGLMDVDATAVRTDVTLQSVLRYLRILRSRDGELPEHLDSLMVVDRNNIYLGTLQLSDLVSLDLENLVVDVMDQGIPAIQPLTPAREVTRLFEDLDLLSAPVVDSDGTLLGRITVDDVIDVIRDENEREVLGRAGLEKHQDLFAPIARTSLHRALWLGINLATAFLAAWVIGLFEASIAEIVALAVLMPVVASMGGVAGTQTLTIVTRGLALDQIGSGNLWKLVLHELGVAVINGVVWALVVAVIAIYWFGNAALALTFGIALIIAVLTGAIAGTLVPVLLKQVGIDPALAGGVVLTTATDAIGFFAFLGLATLLLL